MQAKDYIRAALTRAQQLAVREVILTEGVATVVDTLGGRHELATDVDVPSLGDVAAAISLDNPYRSAFAYGKTLEVPGNGVWIRQLTETAVSLKKKTARQASIEAVIDADEDTLATLRRLYTVPGIDVIVACEGETRALDIAYALAAEINLSGGTASVAVPAVDNRVPGTYEQETAEDQRGPDIFKRPEAGGARWEVAVRRPHRMRYFEQGPKDEETKGPTDPTVSRIVVKEDRYLSRQFRLARPEKIGDTERPVAVIGVEMVKSRPAAKLTASPKLRAILDAMPTEVPHGPWTEFSRRRATRNAARPPKPRTWHQTSEQVAEAFIARQTPRGRMSGDTLFFHGPVAYSIHSTNPIAVFVEFPNGETRLLQAHLSRFGGTKAGTSTGASGDVLAAAGRAGVDLLGIPGEIKKFVNWGGDNLSDAGWAAKRRKDEESRPPNCSVDVEAFKAWFADELERRNANLDKTLESSLATYRKSDAYYSIARMAQIRDVFEPLLSVELPDPGETDYWFSHADAARDKASARQEAIRQKNRDSQASAAPGMT